MARNAVSVLTIAGSDSGGGAGIQADLKTLAAYGVHGLSAITALTAQSSQGVTAIHVPPPSFLRAQLDAIFDDFDVRAVKLGMLATAEAVEAVAGALVRYRPSHVVLDPVMVATSGARLIEPDAMTAVRNRLMPLATIVTPNRPEAEWLTGASITGEASALSAIDALLALGPRAVLLTGGHMAAPSVIDRFGEGAVRETWAHERLPGVAHGTGCTLSSAVAAGLALGRPLRQASVEAIDYVCRALARGFLPGRAQLTFLDHQVAEP